VPSDKELKKFISLNSDYSQRRLTTTKNLRLLRGDEILDERSPLQLQKPHKLYSSSSAQQFMIRFSANKQFVQVCSASLIIASPCVLVVQRVFCEQEKVFQQLCVPFPPSHVHYSAGLSAAVRQDICCAEERTGRIDFVR
jgi:hypothetical protein